MDQQKSTLTASRGNAAALRAGVACGVVLSMAAAQTVASGAPAAAWIGPVAAAYAGIAFITLRGRAMATFAIVSVLALFGSLVADARVHGDTGGIVVLNRSGGALMSMATAVAVLIAGVSVARVRFVPLWVRGAVIVAAVYAVAAFSVGAARSTPYRDLLDGDGLGSTLPRAVQATFIGAFLLLPAGLIVQTVRACRRRLAWEIQQAFAVALTAVLIATVIRLPPSNLAPAVPVTSGIPATEQMAAAATSSEPLDRSFRDVAHLVARGPDPSPMGVKGAPEQLDDVFRELEEALRSVPRDSFETDAVLDTAGHDPDALFTWVRDRTVLVPYRGLLRGPKGVLLSRRGNSLDRALLLYVLLRGAHHDVRLARGELNRDQAKALLERQFEMPVIAANPLDPAAVQPGTASTDATVVAWRDAAARLKNEQQRLAAAVHKRVSDQAGRLA